MPGRKRRPSSLKRKVHTIKPPWALVTETTCMCVCHDTGGSGHYGQKCVCNGGEGFWF